MGRTETQTRQSNLELLRIICMLCIVAIHYTVYGFIIPEDAAASPELIFMKAISYPGKCCVDMFVLISGYFLVGSQFRVKKAVKLWLQASIISVAFTVTARLCGWELGAWDWIHGLFPIPFSVYWFVTTYFVLYLLSGYINSFIRAVSRERLLGLIAVLVVIVSVLPSFTTARMAQSNLLIFIMLYLIAAYIRLYSPRVFESKYCLAVGLGLNLLFASFFVVSYVLSGSVPLFARLNANFDAMEKVSTLLCAVFIFAGFKNLRIKRSAFINTVSASTFGVYLFHHNPYMWELWWKDTLHTPDFLGKPGFLLRSIAVIALTYVFCTLLDMLYQRLIDRPLWRLLDRYWDGWAAKLSAAWQKLSQGHVEP